MFGKVRIAIVVSIVSILVITVVLIAVSLDRLDFQYYGLNYNIITAQFSQNVTYESGLHLIGPTNVLLEIPRIYQQLTFQNINTFTNDYFPLTVSAEVTYKIKVGSDSEFEDLKNYYVLFGSEEQQKQIMTPIARNTVINAVSSRSSVDYQNSQIATSLEQQIESSLLSALSRWSSFDIIVIISSISCQGVSSNLQLLTRQVQSLVFEFERVETEKIELTEYVQSIINQVSMQMQNIQTMISTRMASTINLINKLPEDWNTTQVLMTDETTGRNTSFASSELKLRPQLYLINSSQPI